MNFSGCMEEVFLGPDKVELSPEKEGSHGIEAGCSIKVCDKQKKEAYELKKDFVRNLFTGFPGI